MIFLIIIGGFILFLITVAVFYAVKYRNPYKLIFIFGKKGTGKTTTLTKLAYSYSKRGWQVYSTENVPFAKTFSPSNFGTFKFPPNTCVLCDEVSLIWGNRDFAQKGHAAAFKSVERQFRLQRHDRLRIYLFSQTFDVDLKIRNLADSMYLATKLFNCITWLKAIDKSVVLTKSDSSGQSRIAEDLKFLPFLGWPFGTRMAIFIPRWARYFDSFDDFADDRPPMPYQDFSLSASSSCNDLQAAETDHEMIG